MHRAQYPIVQVRAIGMESPDLLQLLENCPAGGETLIMRMLYILTENCQLFSLRYFCLESMVSSGTPSIGLVGRVRELYKNNPSDVRFLIPVLHGLQKVIITMLFMPLEK